MHVFFSHSYRDVAINSYFLRHFVRNDVPLRADQKSDTWCVAKLERYLFEASGFISVITRRPNDQDAAAYSAYIGHELDLARRARIPRLLFVDQQVLARHVTRFPQDVVPFDAAAPEQHDEQHRAAIAEFLESARFSVPPLQGLRRPDEATLVIDDSPALRRVADEVAELLRRERFSVTRHSPNRKTRAMDDVRLLETLWRSELCVFLLGERLSDAHLALAMAYAHFIPVLRLQHDKAAPDCSPTLKGEIRWQSEPDLLVEFRNQLGSFRRGFVEPVEMARGENEKEALQKTGTALWNASDANLWDSSDGRALLKHIATRESTVQDEMKRARSLARDAYPGIAGREYDFALCQVLYDEFKRRRYAYEIEPQTGTRAGVQAIRWPMQIVHGKAATCIDLACLFAALFEAAGLQALVIVVRTPAMAHALPGYRAAGEPAWDKPSLGDLRRAITAGDAVFIEGTGAVEADSQVTTEEGAARVDKLLDYPSARDVAERLIRRQDLQLVHFVDVRKLRG